MPIPAPRATTVLPALPDAPTPGRGVDLDSLLGDSRTRYFGSGYRRIRQRIDPLLVGPVDVPAVAGTAGISCPGDWSLKNGVQQAAHLGTVDVLAIGVQLAEQVLATGLGLSASALAQSWLREVDIKAGARPMVEGLDRFPVSATLVGTRGAAPDGKGAVSTVRTTVGPLAMTVEVAHPAAPVARRLRSSGEEVAVVEAVGEFGAGLRRKSHVVRDVTHTADHTSAEAITTLTTSDGPLPRTGLGAAYYPAVSVIDALVISVPIGQVLLYGLDGTDRGSSNNLWMRRTVFSCDRPGDGAERRYDVPVQVELDRLRLLDRGDAGVWRSADIVGHLPGVHMRCSVAHQLPAPVSAPGGQQ